MASGKARAQDYRATRAISAFDIRHNFVATLRYELPFDRIFPPTRATKGWFLTGVLRLSSGLPVTLLSFDDRSLINSQNQGVNGVGGDLPNYTPH